MLHHLDQSCSVVVFANDCCQRSVTATWRDAAFQQYYDYFQRCFTVASWD